MAKWGVLELGNPSTECHKLWLGWLRRRYHHAHQNSKRWPQLERPGKQVKCHSRVVFIFAVCDPKFCSRPETKRQPEKRFWRCLIQRTSIQGHCFPRGMKLQKLAWIGIFKLNAQKTLKLAYCRNYCTNWFDRLGTKFLLLTRSEP